MNGLKGKVIVITGGASGLGKATAERFDEEGAKVVIADINETDGKKLANTLQDGLFIKTDVTKADSVENMVSTTVDHYGKVDILFNNAGIDGEQAPTDESTLDNWEKVTSINLDGAFYALKYTLKQMKKQKSGAIINTSSTAGLVGFEEIPPYSASKGALIQLTKAAAIEYAPYNVRVNAISPSVVKTALVDHFIEVSDNPEETAAQFKEQNPLPGWIKPEDVAASVAFLASDDARTITGITLPIDGGYTAK